MSSFVYKPIGQGQLGAGKATFYIENRDFISGGWYDKDGKLLERFQKNIGTPEGNAAPAVKFWAEKPGGAYGEGAVARFTDSSGKVHEYTIPNAGLRFVGDWADPTSLEFENKGPMSAPGGWDGQGGNVPPGFAPGQTGYGAYPAYIGNLFPSPVLANYNPINPANYNFTDPFQFAEKYGDFARKEVSKNFDQSKDLALQSLANELKGLTEFIPAMSALKRQETALDNQFNQQQRTQQVDETLPEVRGDLAGQRERALSYANGRIPDPVQDRAFELGIRSAAADRASAGGFGVNSSAARKASDLLSAEQRVKLSNYGDQLLTSNIGTKASLYLAPTEYANAGQQVNVNPSLSPSQLGTNYLQTLNAMAGLPTSQAFQSNIQQNQFQTGIEQQTNQFNAGNQLQTSMYNATAQNNFAMSLFGYQAGYANSLAGAAQTNINTQFGLQQQQMYQDIMKQYMDQMQNSQMVGSLFNGLFSLLGPGFLGGMTGGKGGKGSGGGLPSVPGVPDLSIPDFGLNPGSVGDAGKDIIDSISPW